MPLSAVPLCEIWRGPFLESVHLGHAVICDSQGQVVRAWGDPQAVVLPRSSSKMIQALPLVTSGAAQAFGLTDQQLALACASHQGAPLHVEAVNAWLSALGLSDDDLRCGPQLTRDRALEVAQIKADAPTCQVHNNCSGKHTGFLTLAQHLGAGPEYIAPDHPVQIACREAFETVTDAASPGFATDGCSAPNFASSLSGLARAMGWFAGAGHRQDSLSRAAHRLTQAMITYPDHVAGAGRACTELMRATTEPVALKTGAEGVFVAILPDRGLGIAVKAADGATRAAECAIAALLVYLGALPAAHPSTLKRLNAPVTNWRGIETGTIRAAEGWLQ